MRILVKTKTKSKIESVERIEQPTLGLIVFKNEMVAYKVSVKEAPVGGRANEAIVKALAKYFKISTSEIRLVSGASIKKKVFELPNL